jgi:subtilase family serine protease
MRPKNLFAIQCAALLTFLSIPALQAFAQNSDAQPRITQAVDETKLTLLKGNTFPLARPEFDQGAAPPSLPMERMLLVLRRSSQQEAALEKLMDGQLDKSSPNFHKWLTPEQFGQQFGPSDQDIQTVTSWLGSHGFQVSQVSKGRTVIEFSGNAGQVQEAFHTTIHSYIVKGEQHWANSSDPQIPTALTPVVVGINTLHNFPKHAAHRYAGEFRRSKETGKVTAVNPQFTFPNQPLCNGSCYAVGPYDFATIYNVLPLWTANIDGTGVTIGVPGVTDIKMQDNTDFRNMFGLSPSNLTVFTNGTDPGTSPNDEPEADIDTQWSGAVAKGAAIFYVASASTNTAFGVDLSAQYIIDNNSAAILTDSYGQCEAFLGPAGNSFYYGLWQQAAAQGISVFNPTGDNGSAGCDNDTAAGAAQFGLQVNGSATTPFDTAVGGTDFNDPNNPATYWSATNNSTTQASALSYIPEVVWNNSCTSVEWGADFGGSTDPVTNCNSSELSNDILVVGGSGGVSSCTLGTNGTTEEVTSCYAGYVKPSWQAGLNVPPDGKRDIPDVSLFAGNGFNASAYIICQQDANSTQGGNPNSCDLTNPYTDFQLYGGTSVATPAMAGILAMVVQANGNTRQGVPNAVLYKLAAQAGASCNSNGTVNSSCIFYDLQTGAGTNAMPCTPGTTNCTGSGSDKFGVLQDYATGTGYDLASGLGSVNAANLVNHWSTVVSGPDFSMSLPGTAPAPTTITISAPGGTGTTTLTITGANGYSGTINFTPGSCVGLPAETTCSFSPATVAGNGSTQLTVTTTAASSRLLPVGQRGAPIAHVGGAKAIQIFVLLAIFWLAIQASLRRLRWSTLASLLVAGCLLGIVACGGGGSGGGGGGGTNPGTPATTNQTIVITATDGTNTHSTYFLLTVQ